MTEKSYPRGHRDAVAWQFRQRSAVGKGPQSQAPFGDWCGIERETYDMYIKAPNNLVEVRALTVLGAAQAPTDEKEAIHYLGAIKVRLELLYEHSKQDSRLLEHLSDEVDWVDAEIERLRSPSNAQAEQEPTPYVAWIAFAENGNIRFWTNDYNRSVEERRRGMDLRAFTLAELVALAGAALMSPAERGTP